MFTLKNEISRKCETSLIAYKTIVIIYSNVDLYCKANCKVSQTESGQVDNGLIIYLFSVVHAQVLALQHLWFNEKV